MEWIRHQITENKLDKEGVVWEFKTGIPFSKIDLKKSAENKARVSSADNPIMEDVVVDYAVSMEGGSDFPSPVASTRIQAPFGPQP